MTEVRRGDRPSPGIVVIGGSTGGIDTVAAVLRGLPRAFPVPVVVVLHRAAASDGLTGLIARRSGRFVHDGVDRERLHTGSVLLAPADYHLLADRERIYLTLDPPEHHARPAVDPLFESTAAAWGPEAVGVILSGMNRDGAAGLTAISKAGGLTIVQDPATAVEPEMPGAALEAVHADHVLAAAEIGPLLDVLCTSRAAARHEHV